jgi:hypothetical protein
MWYPALEGVKLMSKFRLSQLRQLSDLLAALLDDSDLMAELSLIEREHIQGASLALRPLFPIVEMREIEDTVNES